MNSQLSLEWTQVQKLFSVVLCINKEFEIIFASQTLQKYVPATDNNCRLDTVFDISRPSSVNSYEDVLARMASLYLMTSVDGGFAIRGQMTQIKYQGDDALCLLGAPWLFWINSNCPEVRLKLDDFSPQDVQLDQLFFMSGEKRMLEDLEQLNGELKKARQGVEEAKAKESRLFAQMSHEMRTPLNGVVSALTLLKVQELP
jgi:signal transduction histidine kinase